MERCTVCGTRAETQNERSPMPRSHFTLWFQRDKTRKFPNQSCLPSLRKRATYLLNQVLSFLFSKQCFAQFLLFALTQTYEA